MLTAAVIGTEYHLRRLWFEVLICMLTFVLISYRLDTNDVGT